MKNRWNVRCILPVVAAALAGCAVVGRPKLSADEQYFVTHVKPVLERNCLRCHNGAILPGKLDLSNRAAAMNSKLDGKPYLVPGKPDDSPLITAVSRRGTHPRIMPRLEISLTDDQIGVLREWIEDGAVWPAGTAGSLHHVPNAENP